MKSWIVRVWYKKQPHYWGVVILLPFSYLYRFMVHVRRLLWISFFQKKIQIPIIIVGNIVVGGVGKTPVVIAIAQKLQQKGLRVGIVSRGYGSKNNKYPCSVKPQSNSVAVGDEPLLLSHRTGCPVVIDPNRVRAVEYLLENFACDVILSDDGLQHYAMDRALELIVIDGERGFGNGCFLPAGPLREPIQRLEEVDFVLCNGHQKKMVFSNNTVLNPYPIYFKAEGMVQLTTGKLISCDKIEEYFTGTIAAVAGIGNPQRFFTSLSALGLHYNSYPFPDHYLFKAQDFKFSESLVVMTEKDAVKCRKFAQPHWYYLKIDAMLSDLFWQDFFAHPVLKRLMDS